METLSSCPICGATALTAKITATDHTVSMERFNIVSCNTCGFQFTNPRPSETNSAAYYQSDDYISHSNTSRGVVNRLYQFIRDYSIRAKGVFLRDLAPTGKLLDYGCGTGEFLGHMSSRGFSVTGIEPNTLAREQAIRNHGIQVMPNLNNLNAREQFTIITMWHVLEHVHDLRTTLKWLYAALEEGGYLIVAVPNIESADARHYRSHWAALDVPRHLYHFRQRDIRELLSQHGFDLVQTRPMWFDAPYISMLSEQYRGSGKILSLLKGMYWGLYSNFTTLFSTQKTSSCIYILHKPLI